MCFNTQHSALLNREKGFTLIELSIVIVIIGLIVAAVVGGQNLVKQAKLRGVITDVNKYKVAHNTFRLEYGGIAGDLRNAYSYFGASCSDTGANDDDKCSGNGNKRVELVSDADENEAYRYWQHLSLASLIEGSYTGLAPTAGRQADIGINVPATKFENVGWYFDYSDSNGVWSSDKNGFGLGKFRANTAPTAAWINPKDAKSIDEKIDDGEWQTGWVAVSHGTFATEDCAGGGFPPNTSLDWSLSDTTDSCYMRFMAD